MEGEETMGLDAFLQYKGEQGSILPVFMSKKAFGSLCQRGWTTGLHTECSANICI
jgi:hypothetical protein